MKRQIHGLNETASSPINVPDGVYLVRVDRAQFHWNFRKPFYTLRLTVLEPKELARRTVCGRLDCTSKAIWKLSVSVENVQMDKNAIILKALMKVVELHGLTRPVEIFRRIVSVREEEQDAADGSWVATFERAGARLVENFLEQNES